MKINLTKKDVLVDEKMEIVLSGFKPGSEILVKAELPELEMDSSAVFKTDSEGIADLSTQKPLRGSYDWVDSMGLIYTLKSPSKKFLGFSEKPHEIIFSAIQDGKGMVSEKITRSWLAKGVTRRVIHENDLHGVLFMPYGEGPFPAVIVVTGSGGGANETTAALLASHGYAAFAQAYFAFEGRQKDLIKIPLEYFEKGFKWLAEMPQVDEKRMGVTGGSRGGELSLLLGSTFPFIKAVAAYVPSCVRWGGLCSEGNPEVSAWTWKGEDLPYMRHGPEVDYDEVYRNQPIPLTPEFLAAMIDEKKLKEATIEVEKIQGAILLISGEDDQMWPSTMFSERVIQRLKEKNFSFPYEHARYPDAGHGIRPPYTPLPPYAIVHPMNNKLYAIGGKPQAQAFAIEDSWKKVLAFFRNNL